MSIEARHRFAAVVGAGVFLLALLGGLLAAGPATALLGALVAGVAGGVLVIVAGAVAGPPVAAAPVGRRVDRVAAEPTPVPPEAGPEALPGLPDALAPPPFVPGGLPSPDATARIPLEDVLRATDLHQTIRLDAENLQYVLPDVSAEDILREREGIDEAFLKAGAGIEEPGPASENVGGGAPG